MKLFFEGVYYSKTFLDACFGDISPRISRKGTRGGTAMLDAVGYYFNKYNREPFFILPKVFVTVKDGSDYAFGDYLISSSNALDLKAKDLTKYLKNAGWKENIIYELPIWLYEAISKFRRKDDKKQIEIEETLQSLLTPKNEKGESTILDIVIALEDFYKQNEDLFVLIFKRSNSGFDKIDWTRTVLDNIPLINNDSVVYPEAVNRVKEIDYEEELLGIFFNTLRYISSKYDPELKINVLYTLTPDAIFMRQTERGAICKRLKQIKNNYFSDRMSQLWTLVYAFHKKMEDMRGSRSYNDYLLIKDFNIVFEDMIDELIGDRNLPQDIKEQKDGKILDHVFQYHSLTNNPDSVFYVGDSKYYKEGKSPTGTALYKQYTYVKNILQLHFDWYNKKREKKIYRPYRDDKTEGYNISPNFFISADVHPNDSFYVPRLCPDAITNEKLYKSANKQFGNRLFDRDTLFLRQFDINFLFVLHSYIQRNKTKNQLFKRTAQDMIKNDFLTFVNDKYEFYTLTAKDDPDGTLNKTFKKLIGKIYCPTESLTPMILALQKDSADKQAIISFVDEHYNKCEYQLGETIE
ncbi:MAG: hypothetical protein J5932_08065 [Prevotella sp.]|nr:hypothetical protein [Prevotella sp.]